MPVGRYVWRYDLSLVVGCRAHVGARGCRLVRQMAADKSGASGADPVPADKESLSLRMRELLLRSKVEERRDPENGTTSEGERRRRGDDKHGDTHDDSTLD